VDCILGYVDLVVRERASMSGRGILNVVKILNDARIMGSEQRRLLRLTKTAYLSEMASTSVPDGQRRSSAVCTTPLVYFALDPAVDFSRKRIEADMIAGPAWALAAL
jgi:hypothetical protein